MPQLDISTYFSQLFWLVLCFGVLYYYSSRWALPRLMQVLEERWQKTEGTLQRSKKIRAQAQDIKDTYEALLAQRRKEAHQEIDKITKDIASDISTRRQTVIGDIKNRMRIEETRILNKKNEILSDAKEISQSLAENIVKQMLVVILPESKKTPSLKSKKS